MSPSDMKAFDLPTQPASNFSLVLVNYKTPDITRMCLELLREHVQEQRIPVWVVDNDSADASLDYLRSLDWINLIERPSPASRSMATPGMRCSDSARFRSGNLPMSSATTASICSAL